MQMPAAALGKPSPKPTRLTAPAHIWHNRTMLKLFKCPQVLAKVVLMSALALGYAQKPFSLNDVKQF